MPSMDVTGVRLAARAPRLSRVSDEDAISSPEALAALPLRENLRGLSPYGAPQLDVAVALNTNENTHPVPDEVVAAIAESVAAAAVTLAATRSGSTA